MAGKHRRQNAHSRSPEQRGPRPLEIIDALLSDESAVAHRHAGHYLALGGVRVFAASVTARQCSQFRPACHSVCTDIAEVGDPISDWPPVELPPTPIAPGGQSVPAAACLGCLAAGNALSTREEYPA